MRVAFAIDTLNSGGAQRQAVELAVRLSERGDIRARFLTYHPEDFFRPRLDAAGIDVEILPKRLRYDPSFPRTMRANLVARPVYLVHAFLLPPSLWALLAVSKLSGKARPALIASERNEQIASTFLEKAIQRFTYRRADAVTVNAGPVALEIESRLRVPPARIHYIPNGIDLDAWDLAAAGPCSLELEPDSFHIGVVGRIAPQKNHEVLLDALAQIPKEVLRGWRVWVIGRGATDSPEGLRLQARARSSGLDAVMRFVPAERNIAAVMARLSVLALTSKHEGFPNVVLEAMSSRLPVVATRVGDVPNMIEHGRSGFIVPSDDTRALADELMRVYRIGHDRRRDVGAAARSRVESDFTMDRIADRYLELYRSLVRSTGPASQ